MPEQNQPKSFEANKQPTDANKNSYGQQANTQSKPGMQQPGQRQDQGKYGQSQTKNRDAEDEE